MKSIKKALFGLILAGSAAANALAAPIYDYKEQVFVPADLSGPGTLQTWLFGFGGTGIRSGQTFSLEFFFNTPPSNPVTWFGFQVDGRHTVSFDDGGFYGAGLQLTPVLDYRFSLGASRADGHGYVDSGFYDLYLAGTFLVDGAGFEGRAVDDLVPVPEPVSSSLMLAGAAGLLVARRRKA
jgi:hypothetical protein